MPKDNIADVAMRIKEKKEGLSFSDEMKVIKKREKKEKEVVNFSLEKDLIQDIREFVCFNRSVAKNNSELVNLSIKFFLENQGFYQKKKAYVGENI